MREGNLKTLKQKNEKALTFLINNEGSLIFPEVDEAFVDVMESLSSENPEMNPTPQ